MLARQLEVVEVEQALKASLRGVEEETKVRDLSPGNNTNVTRPANYKAR